MNKHDYKQNAYYLLYLIRCVLHGRVPAGEKLEKMDLGQLYQVAQAHSLSAMAAYALESAGIYDKAFEEAKNKAIRKNILLDTEREQIFAEFEKAGIWYMPLKGSILKNYYPQLGMRQMSDNDILIDPDKKAEVKTVMEHAGFTVEQFGRSNHDVYYKPPVCNFEMHNQLFTRAHNSDLVCAYYSDTKDKLIKDPDNGFGYHFSNEDFYIYITVHEYKHFAHSGTGLRNLVDTYVFLNRFSDSLDMDYIVKELTSMDVAGHEKESRELALKVFGGTRLSDAESELLDYYIFSGTYGTTENVVLNQLNKNGDGFTSKLRYVAARLIGPVSRNDPKYSIYAAQYPLFYDHKFLMPLLPFYRLVNGLLKGRGRLAAELKTLIRH